MQFIYVNFYFQSQHYNSHLTRDSFSVTIAIDCTVSNCISNGYLTIVDSKLNFIANETTLTISNILEAKIGMDCENPQRNSMFSYLYSIEILGLGEKFSKNDLNIDLCSISENDYYYSYEIK